MPPPEGRHRRAINPSSPAQHRIRLPSYQATFSVRGTPHFLRVPDGNRVEMRGGDGAANPYLAAAVTLAAGLDGVERGLDPGLPGAGGDEVTRLLPATLLHAVEAL